MKLITQGEQETVPVGFQDVGQLPDDPERHDGIRSSEVMDLQETVDCKILLAEDNKVNQRLLMRVLTRFGAEVTLAENGRVALDLLKPTIGSDDGFDLVLMDIQMPEVDGYAATRILRQEGYQRPILALSANARDEDKANAIEAGCDDHLSKPINRERLLGALKRYSSSRAAATVD